MSLGRLYVPREVDLADRTRGAQRPEFPWAVFSEFRPRPPPAGQYVLVYLHMKLNPMVVGYRIPYVLHSKDLLHSPTAKASSHNNPNELEQ